MTNKHVHYELILKWANGAKIQQYCNGNWCPVNHPLWDKNSCYRVETEPEIDIGYIAIDEGWDSSQAYASAKSATDYIATNKKPLSCVIKITRTDGITTSVEIVK